MVFFHCPRLLYFATILSSAIACLAVTIVTMVDSECDSKCKAMAGTIIVMDAVFFGVWLLTQSQSRLGQDDLLDRLICLLIMIKIVQIILDVNSAVIEAANSVGAAMIVVTVSDGLATAFMMIFHPKANTRRLDDYSNLEHQSQV